MRRLETAWFNGDRWVWLLWPLMLIFKLVVFVRLWCYRIGLLRSRKIAVPVIVVGNISVGGNGKTPLVLALCEWLLRSGYRPGVVTRGYGGSLPAKRLPHRVSHLCPAALVGDEPALMAAKLPCAVVVDSKRGRGASYLLEQCQCDVIVCDDGLQHYALQRDVEIAVVDATRRHGNGQMLPVGPLREAVSRLRSVNCIVYNGAGSDLEQQVPALASKTPVNGSVAAAYSMTLVPAAIVNIAQPERSLPFSQLNTLACLQHTSGGIVAVAGIGYPQRFFALLQRSGLVNFERRAFADHHSFSASDLPSDDTLVIMTEKDAVKCRSFAQPNWWAVAVTAQLSNEFYRDIDQRLVPASVGIAK